MKYCKRCGNAIEDTGTFCPLCGLRVEEGDVVYNAADLDDSDLRTVMLDPKMGGTQPMQQQYQQQPQQFQQNVAADTANNAPAEKKGFFSTAGGKVVIVVIVLAVLLFGLIILSILAGVLAPTMIKYMEKSRSAVDVDYNTYNSYAVVQTVDEVPSETLEI